MSISLYIVVAAARCWRARSVWPAPTEKELHTRLMDLERQAETPRHGGER